MKKLYLYAYILLLFNSHPTHSMMQQLIASTTRKIATVALPTSVGYVLYKHSKATGNHEIIDVSTPRELLDADWVNRAAELPTISDKLLNMQFLFQDFIFSNKARTNLVNFAHWLTRREAVYKDQDYVPLYHGTSQVTSLLFRTIMAEVMHDKHYTNYIKLRDANVTQPLQQEKNVKDFYAKVYASSPQTKSVTFIPGGGVVVRDSDLKNLDSQAEYQGNMLATNFKPLGCHTGTLDAIVRESSFAYLTKYYSLSYQALEKLFRLKGSNSENQHFDNIFKEYGMEKVSRYYEQQLSQYVQQEASGLLQVLVPKEHANNWCYVSQEMGNRASLCSCLDMSRKRDRAEYQARLLLHPSIVQSDSANKTIFRLYVVGNSTETKRMINQMYQIAYEVKQLKDMQAAN